MNVIYLIGFMGTGKTTVGKQLAKELGYTFFDMDEVVETITSRSIPELFTEFGEEGFRNYETKALKSLPIRESIVATGGGAILREENCIYMKENGIRVWLDASPDEIARRLEDDSSRPLLANDKINAIKQLYQTREDIYRQAADYRINTTDKQTNMIVQEIINILAGLKA